MTIHERPFGRCLEDFEVGDVYRHWPGKTITEYDDHLFCMITMNHHPLHTNDWFAEQSVQGRNVVVGNLVYSLVLGMSVPDVSGAAIANLEVETLQHKFPTFHGDTIHAETRVLDVQPSKSKPDRGIVTVETKGFNQHGQEVCYFRRRVMVWNRDSSPMASTSGATDLDDVGSVASTRVRGEHCAAVLRWGVPRLRDLPWRRTRDPWAILVSEVMLQQTQVARVEPRYAALLTRFPSARVCAAAAVGDVVRAWSGLGYNQRAVRLHRAARTVVDEFGGRLPRTLPELRRLPGVGPYTARAVIAYAY